MTFSFPWRTLLLTACAVVAFLNYANYREDRRFEHDASTFADLIAPPTLTPGSPKAIFDRSVFEVLAHIYRDPELYRRASGGFTPHFERVVRRACEINTYGSRHTSLVTLNLSDLFQTCARFEVFDDLDRNLARIEAGLPPVVNTGLYEGEPLVVAFKTPPLAAPALNNQFVNATLLPASVRALRGDAVDSQAYEAAMAFRSADLMPPVQFDRVKDIYRRSVRPPR